MAIPWQNLIRPAACLPCCSGSPTPPAECACALLIPLFASPYADYATAASAISNQTADCYGYQGPGYTLDAFSVDVSTPNEISAHSELSGSGPESYLRLSVSVGASSSVTINWTSSYTYDPGADEDPQFICEIYDCNGNLVASDSSSDLTGSFLFSGLSAGVYYVFANALENIGDNLTVTSDVTVSSTVLVPNPVIALWDDSGTTRKLWACPKLLLPPLTEASGDWYADCAAAASAITNWVSNCIGFFDNQTGPSPTFSATGGTGSVTLAGSDVGDGWVSVNLEAGDTLTVTPSGASGLFTLYDSTGTPIFGGGGPGPYTYPITITDRYIVKVGIVVDPSYVISGGTLTTNPVQALWDSGLTCPSRLDCGDSCP